jgi:hypothetical protein
MFLAPDAVTAITELTIVRTSTHQLPGWRYRSGRSPDWLKFKNPEAGGETRGAGGWRQMRRCPRKCHVSGGLSDMSCNQRE